MFSTTLVLLQLLWLTLASASHFYGSVVNFITKRDSNGNYEVEMRVKATYDGCYFHYGTCYNGNCGHNKKLETGQIDYNSNSPRFNSRWCETETIVTKTLPSNRPFQTREYSCCWVWQSPGHTPSWSILTSVDLGKRSDTNKPNNSPAAAILPFLRVPKNCRRTYQLLSFDPDGDKVRCRYGTAKHTECYECSQHYGFQVDQATCTLQYLASSNQGVYGFELVIEDFPHHNIKLFYSDGSSSFKYAVNNRRKRAITTISTTTARFTNTTITTTNTTTPAFTTVTYTATIAPLTTSTAPVTTTATTTAPFTTTTAMTTTTTATTTPITTTTAPFTSTSTTTLAFSTALHPVSTASFPTTTTPTTTTAPIITNAAFTPTITNHYVPNITPASPTTAPIDSTTTNTSTITSPPISVFLTSTTLATISTPSVTKKISSLANITNMTTTNATMTTTTYLSPPVTFSTLYWGAPFSQLPLQFTFQVDPSAPSCTEGEYLPKFVSPTPLNGAVLMVEVRREIEIKVKAIANYSVPDGIIMSGPLNITKHRSTTDEFTIRWTPTDENQGHYFPICFVVEFIYGSAIYQTEMRCVVVNVTRGVGQVNTVVTCLESSMIVEVEKATLPQLHYEYLRLSDPSNTVCSLQTHSNSTHVVAVVPLNACGTQIEEDADDLLFKNEITIVDNTSDLITRKHQLEMKFFCQYPKRGNVTFTFSAHRENVTVWDKGLGRFTYGFEFFPDQRFVSRIDPRLYPLEYDVGDRIFMEIEATTTVNNTQLFVESCRAAPYDNTNYPHPYTLIENGCNLDTTLIVYPTSNKKEFRFSIEAFKFIGLHDKVYISCSVLMCEAGNPHTRCSRGCQPNGAARARREAVIESGIHYVSQGPLRLRRSVEAGNTGLNLNLVFIAGCALAAVGMICGVLLYKTKNSSFKYQLLSFEEN